MVAIGLLTHFEGCENNINDTAIFSSYYNARWNFRNESIIIPNDPQSTDLHPIPT